MSDTKILDARGFWARLRYYLPQNKPYLWRRPFTLIGRRLQCAAAARFAPGWLHHARVAPLLYASLRMEVTVQDLIGRSIYCNGVFEYPVTLLVRGALRTGDTFLDVGANAGYHSLLASEAVGASGQVLAFEPVPHIRKRLERNLQLNAIANVVVIQAAVASTPGRVEFFVSDNPENSGLSSLRQRGGAQHPITVEATTLDAVCAGLRQPPALIKIDVEGAEAEVLRGGARVLGAADAPCLVFEAYPPNDLELFSILGSHGYEVRQLGYRAGQLLLPRLGLQIWNPFDFDAPTYVAAKPNWRHRGLSTIGALVDTE